MEGKTREYEGKEGKGEVVGEGDKGREDERKDCIRERWREERKEGERPKSKREKEESRKERGKQGGRDDNERRGSRQQGIIKLDRRNDRKGKRRELEEGMK